MTVSPTSLSSRWVSPHCQKALSSIALSVGSNAATWPPAESSPNFRGVTLALNFNTEQEVDDALAAALTPTRYLVPTMSLSDAR